MKFNFHSFSGVHIVCERSFKVLATTSILSHILKVEDINPKKYIKHSRNEPENVEFIE